MAEAPTPQKTVLITGAARRIGRSIALEMARDGWAVAIHCRNSATEAEALAQDITTIGAQARVFRADLSKFPDIVSLVGRCAAEFGAPTCLVNNASEFLDDTIETLDETSWAQHMDLNLKAPIFLGQAMVRHLPAGADGNIVNIIDQRVLKLTAEFFSYTLSKAGLWTATRTLALALAPRVRVNAIAPGPVYQSIHQTAADFAAEQASTLLKRGPTSREIADAVRFILATPSLTGQMIALDGGQHLN